jgi:hypothetical protein
MKDDISTSYEKAGKKSKEIVLLNILSLSNNTHVRFWRHL